MKITYPTMTPAEPDGTETLETVIRQLDYDNIEAMRKFLREHFEMFSMETVWENKKPIQVRITNEVPNEVAMLYRLVIGAAVYYEVVNMKQMALPLF